MAIGNKASPDLIPEISRAPGTSPTPPTQWLQFLDHSTSHKPWKCLRRLSSWTWAGMVLQLLGWAEGFPGKEAWAWLFSATK